MATAAYNAGRQLLYEGTRAGSTAVAPQTAATVQSRADWVYDDVGRLVEERRPSDMPDLPHAITATLYTLTDKPQSMTDPPGRVTTTDYDALDRTIRVRVP